MYGTDVNGCTNTGTVTIFVRPSLIISAGQDIISCGSPVTLTASGANGVTYSWNNGQSGSAISVNPNVTSNYIVTGTDSNGCTGYDTITVHVQPCLPEEHGMFVVVLPPNYQQAFPTTQAMYHP